jgi:hypothetical protein
MQLLQVEVQNGGENVSVIRKLPGARKVSGSGVAQLLLQATEQWRDPQGAGVPFRCIRELWCLPAARRFSSDVLAQLQAAGVPSWRRSSSAFGASTEYP